MTGLVAQLVKQFQKMNKTNPERRGQNTTVYSNRITSNQTPEARAESLRQMINKKWRDVDAHLKEWKKQGGPMKKYTSMEAYYQAVAESKQKFQERAGYFRAQAQNRKNNPLKYVTWNPGGSKGKWKKETTTHTSGKPKVHYHMGGTKKKYTQHNKRRRNSSTNPTWNLGLNKKWTKKRKHTKTCKTWWL